MEGEIKGRKKWHTSEEMKSILVNTCWILHLALYALGKMPETTTGEAAGIHKTNFQTQRPEGFLMARKRIPYFKTLVGCVGDIFLYILTEKYSSIS